MLGEVPNGPSAPRPDTSYDVGAAGKGRTETAPQDKSARSDQEEDGMDTKPEEGQGRGAEKEPLKGCRNRRAKPVWVVHRATEMKEGGGRPGCRKKSKIPTTNVREWTRMRDKSLGAPRGNRARGTPESNRSDSRDKRVGKTGTTSRSRKAQINAEKNGFQRPGPRASGVES